MGGGKQQLLDTESTNACPYGEQTGFDILGTPVWDPLGVMPQADLFGNAFMQCMAQTTSPRVDPNKPIDHTAAIQDLGVDKKFDDMNKGGDLDDAKKVIEENREHILEMAALYGVDPKVVAGAIFTEQAMNVDWKDSADGFLGFYGLDTSIGVGQVRMSTAKFVEDQGYLNKSSGEEGGWALPFGGFLNGTETMAREQRLEDPRTNIAYVAAYLKHFQDTWAEEYPAIAQDPAILGTLYNLGHEKVPNGSPEPNEFGAFMGESMHMMDEVLSQQCIDETAPGPSTGDVS